MSETAAEYKTSKDEDEFDLQKHIEQELIKGSYDRLLPIIQKAAEYAESNSNKGNVESYAKLESLSLELARFALDYLAVKNGIDTKQLRSTSKEEFAEVMANPV